MRQVLQNDETVSEPFKQDTPFIVFLKTYTDGWFVEFAIHEDDPNAMVWKRWHDQPLQEHGALSWVLVYGDENLRFRLNSGTRGATAFLSATKIAFFR